MPPTANPLSKKTKAELMEEYQQLMRRYDELKVTARALQDPRTAELLDRTKDYTASKLAESQEQLRSVFNASVNQLADKLQAEAQKLTDLQEAVSVSHKQLELNYHIQVAAVTLEQLVADHEAKQQALAADYVGRTRELEEKIEEKKRTWMREQEEYEYQIKLRRKRDEESFVEERARRERAYADREAAMKAQEAEVIAFRKQAEDAPKQLERALAARGQEVKKQLEDGFEQERALDRKEWEARKSMFELTIKNLETTIKRQDAEISSLRQDADQARQKAQELAISFIESGSHLQKIGEDTSST